ncbi:hypothetical protein [Marinagarivorans cellulosilyticus]|uniref:Uncharacterized protein n=1 Tax=Marinagarivorans cellulosilyticus TaxID=2721545 RepID=A0AAN1WEZ1_9GAMM|nr:hypothetical protein [Marinagarivorans cellulosilyticus]BCD96383.1 hypothetical protein MARGE09_P0583 [Marinagarivorans cellulosilyticus]
MATPIFITVLMALLIIGVIWVFDEQQPKDDNLLSDPLFQKILLLGLIATLLSIMWAMFEVIPDGGIHEFYDRLGLAGGLATFTGAALSLYGVAYNSRLTHKRIRLSEEFEHRKLFEDTLDRIGISNNCKRERLYSDLYRGNPAATERDNTIIYYAELVVRAIRLKSASALTKSNLDPVNILEYIEWEHVVYYFVTEYGRALDGIFKTPQFTYETPLLEYINQIKSVSGELSLLEGAPDCFDVLSKYDFSTAVYSNDLSHRDERGINEEYVKSFKTYHEFTSVIYRIVHMEPIELISVDVRREDGWWDGADKDVRETLCQSKIKDLHEKYDLGDPVLRVDNKMKILWDEEYEIPARILLYSSRL